MSSSGFVDFADRRTNVSCVELVAQPHRYLSGVPSPDSRGWPQEGKSSEMPGPLERERDAPETHDFVVCPQIMSLGKYLC